MNHSTNPSTPDSAPVQTPPRRKRRVLRFFLGLLAAVVLLVAAAPYLFNVGPVRRGLLGAAALGMHGRIEIGRSSLGWLSPVAIYDLAIVPDDGGRPLASVPAIEGDRPLWKLIFDRNELGEFRIDRPTVRVEVTDKGSNFTEVFGEPAQEEPTGEDLPPVPPNLGVILAIKDATVVVRGRQATQDLEIPRINVTAGLARSAEPGRSAEFVMARGKPIDHLAITPELCNDFLKYIAPVLANSTKAGGEFSIEVEDVRIPLDDPEAGQLAGRFSIHSVHVGPGPLVRELAAALTVPPEMQLANESVVEFEMIEGRVYHEGLQFGFPRLSVRTHGSVGLMDQSLDLIAEVPLAGLAKEGAPLREALSQQTLVIPITGTLETPQVDASAVTRNGLEIGMAALQELLQDDTITLDILLDRLRQRGVVDGDNDGDGEGMRIFGPGGLLSRGSDVPPPAPVDPADPNAPPAPADEPEASSDSGGGLFGGGLLRRRRGVPNNATNAPLPPPPSTTDPATMGAPPADGAAAQRPARRLLRRAIDVAGQTALEAAQQALENAEQGTTNAPSNDANDSESDSPEALPVPSTSP